MGKAKALASLGASVPSYDAGGPAISEAGFAQSTSLLGKKFLIRPFRWLARTLKLRLVLLLLINPRSLATQLQVFFSLLCHCLICNSPNTHTCDANPFFLNSIVDFVALGCTASASRFLFLQSLCHRSLVVEFSSVFDFTRDPPASSARNIIHFPSLPFISIIIHQQPSSGHATGPRSSHG